MFGPFDSRQAQVADLQRGVRTLERLISRLSGTYADNARSAVDRGREAAVDGFGEVAERFRDGAGRAGKEAVRLGNRAAALGEMSIDRLAKDVGLHPLMFLGVALGIGAIIGAARYRHALQNPTPPKRRTRVRQVRKGNRK